MRHCLIHIITPKRIATMRAIIAAFKKAILTIDVIIRAVMAIIFIHFIATIITAIRHIKAQVIAMPICQLISLPQQITPIAINVHKTATIAIIVQAYLLIAYAPKLA
ncbi:hypothetical protein C8B47_03745 [filamentous cyanobacterium CCP4]|nr:hypothetical protein C8B47_03745 [filamentous cyanobacterium CCP4]